MRITADTNVLVRALIEDHPRQSKAAQTVLEKAEIVAITLPTLCELVWVLRSYKIKPNDIAAVVRRLLDGANVVTNRPAAEAGLILLESGGDFVDAVIAYEGSWLGAETFVSFDRQAVRLLEARGIPARPLA